MSLVSDLCPICYEPLDDDSHFVDGYWLNILGEVEVHGSCCPECNPRKEGI